MRGLGKRARDESGKYPVNENDEENVAGSRLTAGQAIAAPSCHSGAMRSIEPGISRFPDAQLRICGLVLTHHPEMTN
jgi:hypothetical protein